MEAYSNYLFGGLVTLAALFISTSLYLFIRAIKLKRTSKRMSAELAKTPASVRVEELREQKLAIEQKLTNGQAALDTLMDAYNQAEKKIQKIKAGLLPPNFKVDDDEDLKAAIRESREKQYRLIESGEATTSLSEWSWFGSKSDGKTLIQNYSKLMIGALNSEVDMARSKMRHNSFDTAIKKFETSVNALEKLAETVRIRISPEYLSAKEHELGIWHSDLVRRQEEKEARKRQRELLREQNKQLGRGSDDDEDELGDQLDVCEKELAKAREEARTIAGVSLAELELKIEKIEEEKLQLEEKFQRAVSQAQITRAGYLYVISNIGSFGEGICKIGMTRRLEPMDRVVELGDASVPYRFDVHTLAFVEDAPKLEKQIHNSLSTKRVNQENPRKEFFEVFPDEVKEIMTDLGIRSSWFFDYEAKEYRESELKRKAKRELRDMSKQASTELPESI